MYIVIFILLIGRLLQNKYKMPVCVRFTYLHSFHNLPTCTLNFKGFALILLKHILKIRQDIKQQLYANLRYQFFKQDFRSSLKTCERVNELTTYSVRYKSKLSSGSIKIHILLTGYEKIGFFCSFHSRIYKCVHGVQFFP